MSDPSDELRAFAAVKRWPVTTGDGGRLYCAGREDGVPTYAWTGDPVLGPLLTIVMEVKSGLRFDVGAGSVVHPGAFEFQRIRDADGQLRLVEVHDLPSSVRTWLKTLDAAALTRLALRRDEKLAVHKETIAITFPAVDLGYTMDRLRTLVEFAALLPRRKAHVLPRQLRPISAIIRTWSVSDDAMRQSRLAAAPTPSLQELVMAWRQHLDTVNSTIEARPESNLSARLMAFSETAMEAEQELLRRPEVVGGSN